jgi:hypothetical protein
MKVYFEHCLTTLVVVSAAMVMMSLTFRHARAASSWYVTPAGNDDNSCLSPSEPCAAIGSAIAKASAGDTIFVSEGNYTGTGRSAVFIDKDLTLSGGWDSAFSAQNGRSTIDGENARRGIEIAWEISAVITRFMIQNGNTGGCGGGISLSGGNLFLNNSLIRNCYAYACGGGILVSSSNIIIKDSAIIGNSTTQWGGGIHSDCSTTIIENSTVAGNQSSGGQSLGGGGIVKSCPVGSLRLYNVTVSSNSAWSGGGIYALGAGVTLQNSIVARNSSTNPAIPGTWDCTGEIGSAGHNLIGRLKDCTFLPAEGDLVNIKPRLGLLNEEQGYHPLLPNSPAINAGNPAGCTDHNGNLLTTDQRGTERVRRCDIGSYEFVPLTLLSPNGRESITTGSVYTIHWRSFPEAVSLDLKYSVDNRLTWTPIDHQVTGTTYDWEIPAQTGNRKKCFVKVIGYNASGVKVGVDKSDAPFTIEVVRLTAPSDPGISLTPGKTYAITWTIHATKTPVETVELYYTKNATALPVKWTPIAAFKPDDYSGLYPWPVPELATTKTRCKVKVILKDANGVIVGSDVSDSYFAIQPAGTP